VLDNPLGDKTGGRVVPVGQTKRGADRRKGANARPAAQERMAKASMRPRRIAANIAKLPELLKAPR
jgi:hypothetical protein